MFALLQLSVIGLDTIGFPPELLALRRDLYCSGFNLSLAQCYPLLLVLDRRLDTSCLRSGFVSARHRHLGVVRLTLRRSLELRGGLRLLLGVRDGSVALFSDVREVALRRLAPALGSVDFGVGLHLGLGRVLQLVHSTLPDVFSSGYGDSIGEFCRGYCRHLLFGTRRLRLSPYLCLTLHGLYIPPTLFQSLNLLPGACLLLISRVAITLDGLPL
mmetsp:Transcript_32071/g.80660  ORF Transcript_32071/g.80660 Transcript_32071/m.80660 type:complete len:215 (-) Transcript_32071:1402-2046(-)